MTQVSGKKYKRRYARHKSKLVAEDENIIEWKLNEGNDLLLCLADLRLYFFPET